MKSALIALVLVPVLFVVVLVTAFGRDHHEAAAAAALPTGCTVSTASQDAVTSQAVTTAPAPADGAEVGGVGLSGEQIGYATTIAGVVKGRGLPLRAAEIALSTAWVESTLHNYLVAVDHDSLGLFQQRPSQGWGTAAQITDPVHATNSFLDRMVGVEGWETTDNPGAVAQRVQISAFPDRYQQAMPFAVALAGSLWGNASGSVSCQSSPALDTTGIDATGPAAQALARAQSMLGKPYCWAGGSADGPTHGTGGSGCPDGTVGFDCSGLALYAWAAFATLPHLAASQATLGTRVPLADSRPGDLVFLSNAGDLHHVAIVWSRTAGSTDGAGQIIEAPTFGTPVRIRAWAGLSEPEAVEYAVRLP